MTQTLIKMPAIWRPLTQQAIFRSVLTAMSFPGRIMDIGELLEGARTELGVLASLADDMVTIADPCFRLTEDDRRMLCAGSAPASEADYILFEGAMAPPENLTPRLGTIYRPESAALLALTDVNLDEGDTHLKLTGPGIQTAKELSLSGLHPAWLEVRKRWNANFPTGVDFIFCDATRIVAIPRTTVIEKADKWDM
jgi:hypothetical protein